MGIKLAMFIGIPCAVGLFALAGPVIDLLFDIDAQRLSIATALMRTSAVGVIFLSLVQTLTGILQGAGKQQIPVINLFIGGIVKADKLERLRRHLYRPVDHAGALTHAADGIGSHKPWPRTSRIRELRPWPRLSKTCFD